MSSFYIYLGFLDFKLLSSKKSSSKNLLLLFFRFRTINDMELTIITKIIIATDIKPINNDSDIADEEVSAKSFSVVLIFGVTGLNVIVDGDVTEILTFMLELEKIVVLVVFVIIDVSGVVLVVVVIDGIVSEVVVVVILFIVVVEVVVVVDDVVVIVE